MPSLDLQAFAKLNLFLHITGQRADGYHLLQSVFVRIDWADTLRIERREDGALHRHDVGATLPALDLCLRAAQSLQDASGTPLGADIFIDKHIPTGAGMGGGSADAAAVLMGLNQLWALDWSLEQLSQLAITLGADVPFFIQPAHAWVEGIGEHITPITLPASLQNTRLAVLKPPAALPTQQIFAAPHLQRNTPKCSATDFLSAPMQFGHNDMQAVACEIATDISLALHILEDAFGPARMTGSGSAVFAWVPNHLSMSEAQTALQIRLPDSDWTGRICHLLPR